MSRRARFKVPLVRTKMMGPMDTLFHTGKPSLMCLWLKDSRKVTEKYKVEPKSNTYLHSGDNWSKTESMSLAGQIFHDQSSQFKFPPHHLSYIPKFRETESWVNIFMDFWVLRGESYYFLMHLLLERPVTNPPPIGTCACTHTPTLIPYTLQFPVKNTELWPPGHREQGLEFPY